MPYLVDYSLILPSRERLPLLEGLLDSVVQKTKKIERLECWCAIDWDDTPTVQNMKRLRNKFPFLEFLVTDRQGNMSVGYYNRLAALACGRFIQLLNDDCLFVTKDWDALALPVLEDFQQANGDGILLGQTLPIWNYSYFPVFSREAYQALSWVQHPEFHSWGADLTNHAIFQPLNRLVTLPYEIRHSTPNDAVHKRMGQIARTNYGCAPGESQRLQRSISALHS